jgi:hypothetical protein
MQKLGFTSLNRFPKYPQVDVPLGTSKIFGKSRRMSSAMGNCGMHETLHMPFDRP